MLTKEEIQKLVKDYNLDTRPWSPPTNKNNKIEDQTQPRHLKPLSKEERNQLIKKCVQHYPASHRCRWLCCNSQSFYHCDRPGYKIASACEVIRNQGVPLFSGIELNEIEIELQLKLNELKLIESNIKNIVIALAALARKGKQGVTIPNNKTTATTTTFVAQQREIINHQMGQQIQKISEDLRLHQQKLQKKEIELNNKDQQLKELHEFINTTMVKNDQNQQKTTTQNYPMQVDTLQNVYFEEDEDEEEEIVDEEEEEEKETIYDISVQAQREIRQKYTSRSDLDDLNLIQLKNLMNSYPSLFPKEGKNAITRLVGGKYGHRNLNALRDSIAQRILLA